MKTCEEMTRCVLDARDRYLIRRQKQRRIALRCTGTAVFCCAAVLIAYPLLSGRQALEESSLTGDVTTAFPKSITTTVDSLTGSPAGSIKAGAMTGSHGDGLDGALSEEPSGSPNGKTTSVTQTVVQQTKTGISTTETVSQTVQTTAIEKTSEISSQTVPTAAIETESELSSQTVLTSVAETKAPAITTVPVSQNIEKPLNTTPSNTTQSVQEQLYDADGNPIPHWDEKTFDQKYGWAGFGELGAITISYFPAHGTVDSAQIGELLGKVWLGGYDEYTDEYKHCDVEAYAISGIDTASEIAVYSPDDAQYYLFCIHDPLAGADDSPSGGDGN